MWCMESAAQTQACNPRAILALFGAGPPPAALPESKARIMTLRRQFLVGATIALLPLPLLAQSNAPVAAGQTTIQQTNVIDALAAAGNYDDFIELARRSGAVETLRQTGPFTLFALNNTAMAKLPASIREMIAPSAGGGGSSGGGSMGNDTVRLAAFVNMHIVDGRYSTAELMGRVTNLRTRNGNMVEINGSQGQNMTIKIVGDSGFGVGGVTIATQPIMLASQQIVCSNGIVHPVSQPVIQ